jgi:hypothetical protein
MAHSSVDGHLLDAASLHDAASGPPGKRNGQYRHGERTKATIAEQRKFSAWLKMLRAGLHEYANSDECAGSSPA